MVIDLLRKKITYFELTFELSGFELDSLLQYASFSKSISYLTQLYTEMLDVDVLHLLGLLRSLFVRLACGNGLMKINVWGECLGWVFNVKRWIDKQALFLWPQKIMERARLIAGENWIDECGLEMERRLDGNAYLDLIEHVMEYNFDTLHTELFVEPPPMTMLRIALMSSIGDSVARTRTIYEALCYMRVAVPFPILRNFGKSDGMVSCVVVMFPAQGFGDQLDSIHQIYMAFHERAGVAVDVSKVTFEPKNSLYITPRRLFYALHDACSAGDVRGRKHAVLVTVPIWNMYLRDYLLTRKNDKMRSIMTAVVIPDEFMRRVETGGKWILLKPSYKTDILTQLTNSPEKFNTTEWDDHYLRLCGDGVVEKKEIDARELWNEIMGLIFTGVGPYIMFRDAMNRHLNVYGGQAVNSSNLCCEIVQPFNEKDFVCCVLATISLPEIVIRYAQCKDWNDVSEAIDWGGFMAMIGVVKSILCSAFVALETCDLPKGMVRGMKRNRSIGVGFNGMASMFLRMGLVWGTELAMKLDGFLYSVLYRLLYLQVGKMYDAESDMLLTFDSVLPNFNMIEANKYDVLDSEIAVSVGLESKLGKFVDLLPRWDNMGAGLKMFGAYVCQQPCAISSRTLGISPGIEPYLGFVSTLATGNGVHTYIAKELVAYLKSNGMYTLDVLKQVRARGGSLKQVFPEASLTFRTAYEIPAHVLVDHAAFRQHYIDQSQSFNLYYSTVQNQTFAEGLSPIDGLSKVLFDEWRCHLKTGLYYLRIRTM